ncbi:MAG: hypothetical protein E7254_12970 [Lachnospiraceae bacterium]|nr:hypothetical protein [Lachnospiraceae bacterium]
MRSDSIYKSAVNDSGAVYFDDEHFDIVSDGSIDVSDELQKAINSISMSKGYGTLFLKEGRYLLSKTIYIPKAVRIIGYGKNRPVFVLKDGAEGFDVPYPEDKGGFKYLFWFVSKTVTDESVVEDADPGTFYSAMTNVDIELGKNNPYAVALRTHYAQHSFVSYMNIEVMSGMAGIYDVGNEMENISIKGGKYAIITTMCSPGWPFIMIDTYFENQSVAAIKSQRAGLTIVRNTTVNTPVFLDVMDENYEKIYMQDCVLENVSEVLFDIAVEESQLTQIYAKNVLCNNVKLLSRFKDTGRINDISPQGSLEYLHGYVDGDRMECQELVDEYSIEEFLFDKDSIIDYFESDIKQLPDVSQWINVSEIGITGDGKTDVTKEVKNAIEKYKVLFFPSGEYRFTDSIELKKDTVIIGLHPYTTRFVLEDNSEAFTGFGESKGFIITPEDGKNIINGIGIATGGRNPRAIAVLWMAGKDSYLNDVKILGGHGYLVEGTGEFDSPYNNSRTWDKDPLQMWDAQYPSVLVKRGGGTFKDLWTASMYASSGFQVEDSEIESNVYCISLEHHQRNEIRLVNSSNWNFFAIQTEEEMAEGEYALPYELIDCENITFNVAYFFRTVFVKTPFEYCVKCYNCKNIVFNIVQNNTQMKFQFTHFLKNCTENNIVDSWQGVRITCGETIIKEKKTSKIKYDSLSEVDAEVLQVERKFDDFRFADGSVMDSKGNFYFIDSFDKRVYMIDSDSNELKMIFESPIKVNSLATDSNDNLLYIGEYVIPQEAHMNGELITNELPPDSYGSSYGKWYNPNAMVVAFVVENKLIKPLAKTEMTKLNPEFVVYPGNRMRDGGDYKYVLSYNPGKAFVAPDQKTIIPVHYDLIRATNLSKARVGEKLYSVDETNKRTWETVVNKDGLLANPKIIINKGDYCVENNQERIFVCENEIFECDLAGKVLKRYIVPERPTTIGIEKDNKIKYMTARHNVYVFK